MLIRELLGWDELLYEALKRRARRNFRTIRQEIRAILAETLQSEVDTIQAELLAELPDEPSQEVMRHE